MAEERAILAGGCFWCLVHPFDTLSGVKSVVSGYTGGHMKYPTYREVVKGKTGHTEAVEITFDPNIISYEEILDIYWRIADPTDAGGQFADRGDSYRPEIFYTNEKQKEIAEQSKAKLQASGLFEQDIVTQITEATEFWPAEDEHQNYYKKNAAHYNRYYQGSGREGFVNKYKLK